MKKNIGAKLRQLRTLRGMTQEELAAASRIHAETVYNLETDKTTPQRRVLEKIAAALNVEPEELLNPAEEAAVHIPVFLDEGARLPRRAHGDDAGFDLFARKPDMVPAHGSLEIDTGVHIAIPKGYAGLVISKSGLLFGHDLISDGLIDPGYTGSIRVKLYNLGNTSYVVESGDKVSQIVFVPIAEPGLYRVAAPLAETERGDGGFGSTGR